MDDVYRNILNDRRVPDRPTRDDLREWAFDSLREGQDPEPGERTHTECPDCGHRVVTGRESMGPEFDGFEDALREVADMFGGNLTDEEFREVAWESFDEALSAVLDDEGPRLDAEVHETLDEFGRPRLRFDPALVSALLNGDKNATVRYDLNEKVRPGVSFYLVTGRGVFAAATVEDVIWTDVGDALDAVDDAGYRHNAESVGDLWDALDGYYEDEISLSTEVAVVLLNDVTEVR